MRRRKSFFCLPLHSNCYIRILFVDFSRLCPESRGNFWWVRALPSTWYVGDFFFISASVRFNCMKRKPLNQKSFAYCRYGNVKAVIIICFFFSPSFHLLINEVKRLANNINDIHRNRWLLWISMLCNYIIIFIIILRIHTHTCWKALEILSKYSQSSFKIQSSYENICLWNFSK